MSSQITTTENGTRWHAAIVALKFIFIAIPGVFVFMASAISLIVWLYDRRLGPNPLLSGAVAITSLALTLLGLGRLSQWRYSLVFISIPVAIMLPSVLHIYFLPELDGSIIALLIAYFIFRAVKRSYEKKD